MAFSRSYYCFCKRNAQEKKKYKIHTVAFYNLENLFDTVNDPDKNDEASPMMEIKANREEIYKKKVHNMARVIADIGTVMLQETLLQLLVSVKLRM